MKGASWTFFRMLSVLSLEPLYLPACTYVRLIYHAVVGHDLHV
jgi:hypothetical protein